CLSARPFVERGLFDAVEVRDHDIPGRYLRHDPLPVVDSDQVAEADGAIEQDREARNVVARQLLQAKADADPERAAEYAEQREIEAHGLQREENTDDEQERAQEL